MKYLFRYVIYFSVLIGVLNVFFSEIFCSIDKCVINKGIAFGISIKGEILITSLLILLIVYIGLRVRREWGRILIGIGILGFSNLVCRLIFDGIPDYIHILSISFNIADIFIVLFAIVSGMLILLKKEG
ncbi:MAG: signal peptidase II [Candidatus Dojkabacteria bacterium]|jgi:lipoprotein signal peptidase|nr:signal peptidase II [Candidatus Dojkabacteria bacterium]